MGGPSCEVRREGEGPKSKSGRSGRGSKSLALPHSQIGPGISISLPHPSFSTSGRRHGQAGVVVRLRHPSIYPSPAPLTTSAHLACHTRAPPPAADSPGRSLRLPRCCSSSRRPPCCPSAPPLLPLSERLNLLLLPSPHVLAATPSLASLLLLYL